ncbi:MAG TPA: metalloregulator ArsR/SmtB family transcription factor, partial [Acetobacteraceae bacterium]|nr:metalloregulator ArsR/SmtB family transcription factor [Acetobacteraceae bacterium]
RPTGQARLPRRTTARGAGSLNVLSKCRSAKQSKATNQPLQCAPTADQPSKAREFLPSNVSIALAIRALANERRLQILQWLKDPRAHFPPQVDGDLVKDGVCGVLIAAKLGASQPTVSEHLKILSTAGLLRSRRIKQWTFYKRDEVRIRQIKQAIRQTI